MNNDERLFLGFDIRLKPEDYIKVFWDQKRRDMHLLASNIVWPLSVDIMVWPSVFLYHRRHSPPYFQFKEAIVVSPQNTRQEALGLWTDLDEMKDTFYKHKNKLIQNVIPLAIVLVSDASLWSDEFWHAVLNPILSINKLPLKWQFLGYDVADRDMISGLSNCGYESDRKELLQKTWSFRLNEYGLIKNLEDAIEFKELSDKRIPEHAPFYVYELWRAS